MKIIIEFQEQTEQLPLEFEQLVLCSTNKKKKMEKFNTGYVRYFVQEFSYSRSLDKLKK